MLSPTSRNIDLHRKSFRSEISNFTGSGNKSRNISKLSPSTEFSLRNEQLRYSIPEKPAEQLSSSLIHQSPDFSKAWKHYTASMVNRHQYLRSSLDDHSFCPCCQLKISRKEVPLCSKSNEIYFLGPTTAILFEFIFFILIIILVIFPIQAVLPLIDYLESKDIKSSLTNFPLKYNNTSIENFKPLTDLILILILILFCQLYRYQVKKYKIMTHKSLITPSDYSILVTIPRKWNNKLASCEEIQTLFSDYISQNYNFNIVNVTMPYKIKYMANAIRKIIADKTTYQSNYFEIYEEFNKKFSGSYKNMLLQNSNIVIISFNHINEAKNILKQFEFSLPYKWYLKLTKNRKENIKFFFNGNLIKVKKAPEISDIIWENAGQTNFMMKLKTYTLTLTLEIFIFSLLLIYEIFVSDSKMIEVTYKVPIFTVISGCLENYAIKKLTKAENHFTVTIYQRKIIFRLTLFSMLNTIGVLIFLQFTNGYNLDLLYLCAITALATHILQQLIFHIFDFSFYWKKLKRRIANAQQYKCKLSQFELNQLFTNPQMPIEKNYSKIFTIMLLGFLLMSCNFTFILLIFMGLILIYIQEKVCLLRKYSLPSNYSIDISLITITVLEVAIIFTALGQLGNNLICAYDETLNEFDIDYNKISFCIVNLAMALINIQLPWNKWNKSIFNLKRKVIDIDILKSTFTYEEAQKGFKNDYYTDNPINYSSTNDLEDYNKLDEKSVNSLCKSLINYLNMFPKQNDIFSRNKLDFPVNYGYGLAYHYKNCRLPYGISLLAPVMVDENIINKSNCSVPIIQKLNLKQFKKDSFINHMEHNSAMINGDNEKSLNLQNMKSSSFSSSQMIKTLTIDDKQIDKNNLNYLLSLNNDPKNIIFSSIQNIALELNSLSPI